MARTRVNPSQVEPPTGSASASTTLLRSLSGTNSWAPLADLGLDDVYVNVTGDVMTGDLTIENAKIGQYDANTAEFSHASAFGNDAKFALRQDYDWGATQINAPPSGTITIGIGQYYDIRLDETSGSGTITIGARNIIRTTRAAAQLLLHNYLTLSDSEPAFSASGNGAMEWGAGGSSATDVKLYRASSAILKTDGRIHASAAPVHVDELTNKAYVDTASANASYVKKSGDAMSGLLEMASANIVLRNNAVVEAIKTASAYQVLASLVTSDAYYRYQVNVGGQHAWGGGPAVPDLYIERSGASAMLLTGSLEVTQRVTASATPTASGHLTNKLYVDAAVASGGILVDQTFDRGTPVWDSASGKWITEHLARRQDLDDLREEFEGHNHDERYAAGHAVKVYRTYAAALTSGSLVSFDGFLFGANQSMWSLSDPTKIIVRSGGIFQVSGMFQSSPVAGTYRYLAANHNGALIPGCTAIVTSASNWVDERHNFSMPVLCVAGDEITIYYEYSPGGHSMQCITSVVRVSPQTS